LRGHWETAESIDGFAEKLDGLVRAYDRATVGDALVLCGKLSFALGTTGGLAGEGVRWVVAR
jgi:hypothetical protein